MLPTVRTYMNTDTHALRAGDGMVEAVARLIDSGVTGAPVVDDGGRIVGLITEYECLRLLTRGLPHAPEGTVGSFMRTDVQPVTPDMDIYYVAGLFVADPTVRRFPVVEGERLVGVITRKDILRAVTRRITAAAVPRL